METILTDLKLDERLLDFSDFVLFKDLKEASFPTPDSESSKDVISRAEKLLTKSHSILPASLYMRFMDDGDRKAYETLYFERRRELFLVFLAEKIEQKGRFLPKIVDLLWAILEETTWVVPAHNLDIKLTDKANLPDCFEGTIRYIDLFAAETANLITCVWYYLGDKLYDFGGNIIQKRVYFEIERHIIRPYLDVPEADFWWYGISGKRPNNWNPWIHSNILPVCAVFLENVDERKEFVRKCVKGLDLFINGYDEDGGCDEGAGYWNAAAAALYDCLEALYDMTDGSVDLFGNKKIKTMMEFLPKIFIHGDYVVNYGDAHPKVLYHKPLFAEMSKRFNSELLAGFSITREEKNILGNTSKYIRLVRELLADTKVDTKVYKPEKFTYFPDMQLCMMRSSKKTGKGFCAWLKGGNNAESHNHNDVGSIGLFHNGKPIFIDFGSGQYTKLTFSKYRYTLFANNSIHHNLPLINGKGEKAGAQYKTSFFEAEEGIARAGLKRAYENHADIKKFERTLKVSEDAVEIKDEIELKNDGEVIFQFYTTVQPKATDYGVLIGKKLLMEYTDGLDVKIEKHDFPESSYVNTWQSKHYYRIMFTAKSDKITAEFKVSEILPFTSFALV